MRFILFLRILNRLALILAALNLFFALAGRAEGNLLLFLLLSLAVWLAGFLPRLLRPILLLLPVAILAGIGAWSFSALFHLALAAGYGVYLSLTGLDPTYEAASKDFNTGLWMALALFGVSVIAFDPAAFETAAAPYILIYLLSALVTLRTVRDSAAGAAASLQRHAPALFGLVIAILLGSGGIRRAILLGLRSAYLFLTRMLEALLGWLILFIGEGVARLIGLLNKIALRRGMKIPPAEGASPMTQEYAKLKGQSFLTQLLDSHVLSTLLELSLLALAAYFLVRFFRRRRAVMPGGGDQTEVRESIRPAGGRRRSGLPWLHGPETPALAVRRYYREFLHLSAKRGIALAPSDTTAEISTKAAGVFERSSLEALRALYLEARYGGGSIDRKAAEQARLCLRSLKRIDQLPEPPSGQLPPVRRLIH